MSEDRPQYQAERDTVPTNAEIAERLRAMSIASLEGRAAFGASARSDCCASNGNYEERTDK